MRRLLACMPTVAGYLTALGLLGVGLYLYEPVFVSGESMHPSLHAGDVAIVRRGGGAGVGQIALLGETGGSMVLHRVTERLPDGSVRTWGDANDYADRDITPARRVLGTLVIDVPFGRWRRHLLPDLL